MSSRREYAGKRGNAIGSSLRSRRQEFLSDQLAHVGLGRKDTHLDIRPPQHFERLWIVFSCRVKHWHQLVINPAGDGRRNPHDAAGYLDSLILVLAHEGNRFKPAGEESADRIRVLVNERAARINDVDVEVFEQASEPKDNPRGSR